MISKAYNSSILYKIILPAIICFLINYLGDGYDNFLIVIIPFSLLIILCSYHKMKYNFIITFISLIILSFISLYGSILIYLGGSRILENLMNLKEGFPELIYGIAYILSFSIFPLILIFYVQEKLFKITKSNFTNYIKGLAFSLLSFLMLMEINNGSLLIGIWQFITVLGTQSFLYQKELIWLFNKSETIR
ncbi:hypothetical protein ML462_15480 [Gramella lutea]|uniref:Uncharacterized protein n=1 Tax=Christiangramia lutea TaxID=1607951 RepID=A0A9X2AAC3_9FLAO|nr:hypothetical protein [Christiangramia lutea]MCH4824574.1 hypothetical protein [Christiangramia lutea]